MSATVKEHGSSGESGVYLAFAFPELDPPPPTFSPGTAYGKLCDLQVDPKSFTVPRHT